MKKIIQAITGGLMKDVGKVIDNLHTSDEERLEAKRKLQELFDQADKEAQDQVTERWKLDMQSDSFLSKNIRPLVLVFLTVMFTLFAFTDGNIGRFEVQKEYIPIFQSLLITVYGAYFVGRTWEKNKRNGKEDR
jgi:tRNA U38,U39,U40 pseudouridine synthase TruA